MRIVLDTNILVSALLKTDGPPAQLLAAWKAEKFVLITSEPQLTELYRVLCYPKLKKYISQENALDLVTRLRASAEYAADLPSVEFSDDPADNRIIATALIGHAKLLVTGDKKHLLSLAKIDNLTIVTAKSALEILESS